MRPAPRISVSTGPKPYPTGGREGNTLFLVLALGVVVTLLIMGILTVTGHGRASSVKAAKETRDYYIADAGFTYVQNRVAAINQVQGVQAVTDFMTALQGRSWQPLNVANAGQGFFRVASFAVERNPFSVNLRVEGSKTLPRTALARVESIEGVLRAPQLTRYARYIEGPSPANYGGGSVVDGEILISGRINLLSPTVRFTRMVGTGDSIRNRENGDFVFGKRERIPALPTLADAHINRWDPENYDDVRDFANTYENIAATQGITLFPDWGRKNATAACKQARTGPCNELFASCFDNSSTTLRSPVIVAGSAVHIDLSNIQIVGGNVNVTVNPVVADMGPNDQDYLVLGTPAVTFSRPLSQFREGAVIYFPGDIYLEGSLTALSVTIVSGDDVFLTGGEIGPPDNTVDAGGVPIVLGIMMQDRLYIHESSDRTMRVRAAILAENDEVIYRNTGADPDWRFGNICKREILGNLPPRGGTVDFASFFRDNFIWDDTRTPQSGFGREFDEEMTAGGGSMAVADDFGVIALPQTRSNRRARWSFQLLGSLISRQPGSMGLDCNTGWVCDEEGSRVSYFYDDALGTVTPPRFFAPKVNDNVPSQVVGYKRTH